jgi:hypothetical protein
VTDEEALHLSLLPDPEAALAYLDVLRTGRRAAVAAHRVGLTPGSVKAWRAASTVFDAMCNDAEEIGIGEIDDAVLMGVRTYQPGWAGAAKLVLQRRDEGYSDKSKIDRTDTVKVVKDYGEASPDAWEEEAKS